MLIVRCHCQPDNNWLEMYADSDGDLQIDVYTMGKLKATLFLTPEVAFQLGQQIIQKFEKALTSRMLIKGTLSV